MKIYLKKILAHTLYKIYARVKYNPGKTLKTNKIYITMQFLLLILKYKYYYASCMKYDTFSLRRALVVYAS